MIPLLEKAKCKDCGVGLQGASVFCVTCYKKRLKRCPECWNGKKGLAWKYQEHEGRGINKFCGRCGEPHDDVRQIICQVCKNERFLFDDK